MKIFQIGAGGNVGRRLAHLLTSRGDTVSGMHRSPDQGAAIAQTGATPVRGDLIEASVAELAALMAGHDAVVFSAGAHGTGQDKTTLIDGKGLEKSVEAARAAGARRFILVSAFPDSERGGDLGEGFEHYMRVKKTADVYLARSDLDWVIVRPGLLTDAPGTGLVTAGPAIEYGRVSRDNVAAFIAAALPEQTLHRVIVELTDGDQPVDHAIAQLTRA
ncbi:MAG: NAD(P)-binding oxidoreductase [Microbacterium sp.]